MKRRDFLAAAALLPLVRPVQTVLAQSPSEAGFTSLFNGENLDGWQIREGPESAFYVKDGAIVVHEGSSFPTWLSSVKQYENFDFRCEFWVKGWTNSGLYLHAPEHGRNTWVGLKLNIFHQPDKVMRPESMGSIFPLIPPRKVNVRNQGEWNTLRVLMDWPRLQVWTNEELIHDLNVEQIPELRDRLRRGYLGFESLSYPIRFRNIRIKELSAKEQWEVLYERPADLAHWVVSEGTAAWQPLGQVLWVNGLGHLATKERYRDFALQLYVRHSKHHNGGILFRTDGQGLKGRHYEIQLHDVEGARYPTGSLYNFRRATYPRIEPEKWWLLQLVVQGKHCLVRINGDTVVEYDELADIAPGHIELQAHQAGRWLEFKQIKVKRL